jgi:hypothetical protein
MLDRVAVYTLPHARDGLVMQAWDEDKLIDVFMGREAVDRWRDSVGPLSGAQKWGAPEYTEFGNRNIDAIASIVATKYEGSPSVAELPAYVEVSTSDVDASSEVLRQEGSLCRLREDSPEVLANTSPSHRQDHARGALAPPLLGIATSPALPTCRDDVTVSQNKLAPLFSLDFPDAARAVRLAKDMAQRTGRTVVLKDADDEEIAVILPPRRSCVVIRQ